jgi:hypothetical protein
MFLGEVAVQDMQAMNITTDLAVLTNLTLPQATPHDIQELAVSVAGMKRILSMYRHSISWSSTY